MNYVPPRTKTTVSNSIKKILKLFPKKTIKAKLLKTTLKGFAKFYEVDIVYYNNSQKQLISTVTESQNYLVLKLLTNPPHDQHQTLRFILLNKTIIETLVGKRFSTNKFYTN